MPVSVTETAAREIFHIIEQQGLDAEKVRLRVGVKGGGCAGFSYILDLTESEKDTDEAWDLTFSRSPSRAVAGASQGHAGQAPGDARVAVAEGGEADTFTLRVICDPKSYLYLNGTVIDFKDEVMGRGFVFNNPNSTSTCGCGSSFAA